MSESKILSHLDKNGQAHMVDVSPKPQTTRTARAEGFVFMSADQLDLVYSQQSPKGDVLAVARIAGIMGAKKTADLIPLCHILPISSVTVEITPDYDTPCLRVESFVKVTGQTGVEMEALTAVSIACLTLYDMLKSAGKSMTISGTRLIEKTGGRSGNWRAENTGIIG